MANVYEIVTDRIIKKLESGVIPWRKPWNSCGAVSWDTQREYRGINAMLLDPGEYATFRAITKAGGKVKKGAKSQIAVFWKMMDGTDSEGNPKQIPYMRYYSVFEINTQAEGLKSKRKDVEPHEHNPIQEAEEIKEGYRNCPPITFAPGKAFYVPSTDSISVPEINDYDNPEEFYSTLFHEMTHSTGHKSRLHRSGILDIAAFGSETYSKEELVAEIGAAMLCTVAGIDQSTFENSASYISGWLRKLKGDSKLIVSAASQAQKAADHIRGIKGSYEA
jgi:antirestriction protein ArdC